jgi:hypothetical protein
MRVGLLVSILLLFLLRTTDAQVIQNFTGNQETFRDEIIAFMGPNLNPDQKITMDQFLVVWDSLELNQELKTGIINISSQMAGRRMRPSPGFILFFGAVNTFTSSEKGLSYFGDWLKGLSETIFDPRYPTTSIEKYLDVSRLLISENTLFRSNSVRWKVAEGNLSFTHDTVFKLKLTDATLVCYSQNDSSFIRTVSGTYYPESFRFHGETGLITWEKAGFTPDEVYARIYDYTFDATRNSLTSDSAMLFHYIYFRNPVPGRLTDQAFRATSPERSIFPKFETKTKEFVIDNIFKGVNYKGGLELEGANIKGTGESYFPATMTLYRGDTLAIIVRSKNFLITKNSINSQESSMTLYLEDDSVFHANLGFAYNVDSREVNFFRTNSPVSRSPYFNSFHNLDMYFEYFSWDMDELEMKLTRSRGASISQASFESISFFKSSVFERMMYYDDVHPLYQLKDFSRYYYSESFPVVEYARWLNKPLESVTAMCIDLANKGFLYYDRSINEVTIKQKVDDYINSFARKKDYDVISVFSEVSVPMDNAVIDLRNYNLTIYGVSNVFLSDSQRVAIFPYENKIVLEKNRNIRFDGVVVAGLFTIFGHNFSFNYDTFNIHLASIDSIQIAVETDKVDNLGNPIIEEINNLIQLGTAELFIDAPNNKSGRRSLEEYPIINATTYSYIFFDRIPGLEGIYNKEDYYFKVDPFSYNNIDHYKAEELNLTGEFHGGKILRPSPQKLIIQDDNSLGFSLNIPTDGLEIYEGKGKLFNFISMSNNGLVGSGSIQRLSGTTKSENFMFFPDSMITTAPEFNIIAGSDGRYPDLSVKDADIKWIAETDEWFAYNKQGKDFEMYSNGTKLAGFINQTPGGMNGAGIINRPDSRLSSDKFNFTAGTIAADSSDYSLKALSGDGIAFLAENAVTVIDFPKRETRLRLNTGSSFVKFPEIEFISKMTDFVYDLDSQVLNMKQEGLESASLLTPDELLAVNPENPDTPTFFSTNNMRDTIKFAAAKGFYSLKNEQVEADGVNYIRVADALIQPDKGKVVINKRAVIAPMTGATLALNNKHLIHTANVQIASSRSYSGSGILNYSDENGNVSPITMSEIRVDTLNTNATGFIPANQDFKLSPFFTFSGDVKLSAKRDFLTFTGGAGLTENCNNINSESVKFKAEINPVAVMIPVGDKPRDMNDNMIFSGSFVNTDSTHIYPAFLSPRKSWSDVPLISAEGYLYYEKATGNYKIATLNKLTDNAIPGNMIALDKNFCVLTSEGKINFGANYDLLTMTNAGKTIHNTDSGKLTVQTFIALDFHFSSQALRIAADELRLNPSARPVSLNTDFYRKGMSDLLGEKVSKAIGEEIGLFGTVRSMPPEFNYELLLNDVTLVWNEASASFRSTGKIGIGFIGQQPVNVYVDGYIEIQRRRTGDLIDIYLKADESTWYYFSYFRGVLMTLSGNNAYNSEITSAKLNDRKHPKSSVRVPYTYMISVENRHLNFIRRMTGGDSEIDPDNK